MKQLLCFLPLALLVLGCSDDNKITNPTPVKEIWPLKVGNQWTFEDQVLDSAGNVVQLDTTIWLITKDTVIQGATWYIFTINGVPDPEVQPGANRSDGVWAWDGSSGFLAWKYPTAVGDTWLIWTDTATVESINETVAVPAGTFVCLKYKWVGDRDPDRAYQCHYLSPGIGRVKTEEFFRTAGGFVFVRFRNELISFTVL
jgi:hypothetical protein